MTLFNITPESNESKEKIATFIFPFISHLKVIILRMIRYYCSSISEKCNILSNYLFVYVYHAETGQCQ